MATEKKPVPDGTQKALIVRALADGRWHSAAEIRRRVGPAVISTQISRLRRDHGLEIERRFVKGKERNELANQYRLRNAPAILPEAPAPEVVEHRVSTPTLRTILDRDSVPRTPEHRYRIYRLIRNELELAATAPTKEQVGVKIIDMGLKGEFAGSCIGILDTHGVDNDVVPGDWCPNPYDTEPLPSRKEQAA